MRRLKASKRRMLLRPYSLMGHGAMPNCCLWQIAESPAAVSGTGDGDYADGDGVVSEHGILVSLADQALESTKFAAAHWAIRSG